MKTFCFAGLGSLMRERDEIHVSIYMPTHVGGGQNPQDPVRLKNLLREAEEQLSFAGLRSPKVRGLLKPAKDLLTDNVFWRQQSNGLALLFTPDSFTYYCIPTPLQELVTVGRRFHLKPLIPLIADCRLFYVLALSLNRVRLLQCTSYGSVEVDVEGVPKSLSEAFPSQTPRSEVLRYVAKTVPGESPDTIVHRGTGMSPHYKKRTILRFFQKVDDGLRPFLREESAPLVLAAVDYLCPLYRKANTYANLLPEGISGSPDELSEDILRPRAWEVVEPYFRKAQDDAVEEYQQSVGTGLASSAIEDALAGSYHGLVRVLFVAKELQIWGRFDPMTNKVEIHEQPQPGDQDLLDLAAYHAHLNGGAVYVMEQAEMPGGREIAAVFRYWPPTTGKL